MVQPEYPAKIRTPSTIAAMLSGSASRSTITIRPCTWRSPGTPSQVIPARSVARHSATSPSWHQHTAIGANDECRPGICTVGSSPLPGGGWRKVISVVDTHAPGALWRSVRAMPQFGRLLAVRVASQFGDGLFNAGLAGAILV